MVKIRKLEKDIGEAYWPTVLGCLCSCYMLVSSSGKDKYKCILSNILCKYTKEGDAKVSIIKCSFPRNKDCDAQKTCFHTISEGLSEDCMRKGWLVQNNYKTSRQTKVGATFLS